MQIYVDTDDDLRLSRRILRDIELRGRDIKGVISQYTRFVKPAQDKFVTPSRRVADVIIPWHEYASCSLSLPVCSVLILLAQLHQALISFRDKEDLGTITYLGTAIAEPLNRAAVE